MEKNLLVRFRVGVREKQMLDALCERLGKKPSELCRFLLTEKFLKVFPKYAERKNERSAAVPEEELSDEQFCEKWGGRVVKGGAGLLCQMRSGGTEVRMLISDRDAIESRGKQIEKLKEL